MGIDYIERLAEMTSERDLLRAALTEANTLVDLADSRILELESRMVLVNNLAAKLKDQMVKLHDANLKNSAL
jgi:hypothetical protein